MARLLVACVEAPAYDVLRAAVGEFHGVPADRIVLGHDCARCGSDQHGRPVLLTTSSLRSPAHVSLARAGGMSVVAVTDAGPVGVDVERTGAGDVVGLPDVALHPAERGLGVDPTTAWVRTEALLKAYGLGLAIDPSEVAVDGRGLVAWDSVLPRPTATWSRDIEVPGYQAAAVVLLGDAADGATLSVTISRR